MHKFNTLFLVTSIAIASHAAFAEPTNYTHLNGSTVVDINTPDANGLSHNIWSEFNVSEKGMVLNNSTENLIRDSGNIGKNSNLSTAATVILNEVVSNKASTLSGFIEVAGQQADVIIANPNGITCSGCSFINTSHTTLTTGTPVLVDGVLTGFNVSQGTVTIGSNGLTNDQSYTDILAETIRINGLIETDSLKAIAGIYTYDSTSGEATTSGSYSSSSTGIDVSALGGVTAGVIQLQTTKSGAGVNNSGTLSTDSIQITSNGTLINSGSMTVSGDVTATSAGKMSNTGSITGNNMQLTSSGALNNSGTITASGDVVASATGGAISNSGSLTGDDIQLVSSSSLSNSKTITASGNMVASSGGAMSNSGSLTGNNVQLVSSSTLSNSNTITASGSMVASSGGAMSNTGSLTGNNVQLVSSNTLSNSGTIEADNTLYALALGKISNSSNGTLSGTAANQLISYIGDIENKGVISSDGAVYVRTGYMLDSSYALTSVADTSITNSGSINGVTGVTLQATKAINLSSTVDSQGTTYLGATTVKNTGTVSGNNITVYSDTFENSGTMQASNQFMVTGLSSISNYGTLKGKTLTLNTDGSFNSSYCSWFIFCSAGTLSAETLTINAPTISAISDIDGTIVAQVIELNKPDSTTTDSTTDDSATTDSNTTDSTTDDSATTDSNTTDSTTDDSATTDSNTTDSTTDDSATTDSNTTDSTTDDSATTDSNTTDSAAEDSATTGSTTTE